MHLGRGEKFGIIATFLIFGTVVTFLNYPIISADKYLAGEVINSYHVPTEGGSKKYIRVLLADGTEVRARVNKTYKNLEGKKVKLLKKETKGIKVSTYIFQEIIN